MRALLTAAIIAVVSSQVIGIDFGTEFWKAAIISPGKGFVVVENTKSDRKTPNVVPNQLIVDILRRRSETVRVGSREQKASVSEADIHGSELADPTA